MMMIWLLLLLLLLDEIGFPVFVRQDVVCVVVRRACHGASHNNFTHTLLLLIIMADRQRREVGGRVQPVCWLGELDYWKVEEGKGRSGRVCLRGLAASSTWSKAGIRSGSPGHWDNKICRKLRLVAQFI